jgi:predicted Zn-dependent protease
MAPLIPSEQTKGLFLRITHYFTTRGYTVPISLDVVESKAPNAFVRKGREVVLTSAMARQVTEPSEVAFILAHEVAHVALGHHVQGGISAEVAADRLALEVVTALGFNPCSGSSVLERLGSPSQLTLVSVTPRLHALHDQTSSFCG